MDSKKRILIVDDEQINLEFFEVMLGKLGFEVWKAENGLDALESVKKHKPDIILLDNVMPKLSGWEVTKILKTNEEYAEYADIPIIMFSAMDDVKDKVEGLELGAEDYITKPFNFSEVLARIRAVLRNRELVHQIEKREERIHVTEELNARLLAFTSGLKGPLGSIATEAAALGRGEGQAEPFVARVAAEAAQVLGDLDELEGQVASLKQEAEKLKKHETAITAIKSKLRGH